LANQYFDTVLVHADPTFARLEESFAPRSPLRIPVYYTGFVLAEPPSQPTLPNMRARHIIVSAGGGVVGEPLLRAAIEAHALLWPTTRMRMQIVAGPFLPEAVWQSLRAASRGQQGLQLRRVVPHLGARLCNAAASVSQCGYNTALDILRARVPALVVPFATETEDEQRRRAQRLEQLGAVRVLDPQRLTVSTLAAAIEALPHFQPRTVQLDMAGAHNTTQLVDALVRTPQPLRPAVRALTAQGVS
jgi:predicted glycosyltransferase